MDLLVISILLSIPTFILICLKKYKVSACCLLVSITLGLAGLFNFSVNEGYAEEGLQFTYGIISEELKAGNEELVIQVLDETDMNSNFKNRYNVFERMKLAKANQKEKEVSENDASVGTDD